MTAKRVRKSRGSAGPANNKKARSAKETVDDGEDFDLLREETVDDYGEDFDLPLEEMEPEAVVVNKAPSLPSSSSSDTSSSDWSFEEPEGAARHKGSNSRIDRTANTHGRSKMDSGIGLDLTSPRTATEDGVKKDSGEKNESGNHSDHEDYSDQGSDEL